MSADLRARASTIAVATLPAAGGGHFAHYEHAPAPSAAWIPCNVRAIIGTHFDAWRDDFDAWHGELCRIGASRSQHFFFSALSRPNLWVQAGSLKPLFFAAGVCEWMRQHPDCERLHLVGCPPEVLEYVRELGGETVAVPALPDTESRRAGLRSAIGQLRAALRGAMRRSPDLKGAGLLFYSHVVNERGLRAVGDHFFGCFHDAAADRFGADSAAAYIIDGDASPGATRQVLGGRRLRSALLFDALSLNDVPRLIGAAFEHWRALSAIAADVPPITIGGWRSRTFTSRYLAREGWRLPPVTEHAVSIAMTRMLRRGTASSIIYPYEEKGVDRALLFACRDAARPVKAVAYAHPAQTTAHLALRSRRPGETTPPQPDAIGAAGPFERDYLTGWGRKPPQAVVAVGSHRHAPALPYDRDESARRELRVLFITGHGFELSMLANLVAAEPAVFDGCDVLIRRSSSGWFEAQDLGIKRLQALSGVVRIGQGTLREQIGWCDLALFSSTTAGIEAMLGGRLAAYVPLHDVFPADPTLGSGGAFARCDDAAELRAAFGRARRFTRDEYIAAAGAQRAFASQILAPPDPQAMFSLAGIPA